jgi:hypothetical protein
MYNHLDLDDDALRALAQPVNRSRHHNDRLKTETIGVMVNNIHQLCPQESPLWHSRICQASLHQETAPGSRL